MSMFGFLIFVTFVVQSSADITGSNPSAGSCLCIDGNGVNVRSSACGSTVLGSVNRGSCFKSRGQKRNCVLNGARYDFFQLEYRGGPGWVAGTLLVLGTSSRCSSPVPGNPGGCPNIVRRSQWGAKPPESMTYIRRPVSKVAIHHTASSSCNGLSTCAPLLRSFQNDHMKKNWGDIGYNFLVGEDGNVYEGRGWDYVGTHAKGCNSVSIGISVIGTFSNRVPNSAALNAVKQLISCGVSQGKLSSSYTLHGHRDGSNTECPGNSLYNEIKRWSNFRGKPLC